jgi:hypothetical protein
MTETTETETETFYDMRPSTYVSRKTHEENGVRYPFGKDRLDVKRARLTLFRQGQTKPENLGDVSHQLLMSTCLRAGTWCNQFGPIINDEGEFMELAEGDLAVVLIKTGGKGHVRAADIDKAVEFLPEGTGRADHQQPLSPVFGLLADMNDAGLLAFQVKTEGRHMTDVDAMGNVVMTDETYQITVAPFGSPAYETNFVKVRMCEQMAKTGPMGEISDLFKEAMAQQTGGSTREVSSEGVATFDDLVATSNNAGGAEA